MLPRGAERGIMTSMNRSALLWAGLLTTILALTGCGEGPDMIVDGGPCQNTPHLCPPDSATSDGSICVPFGDEADNCTDEIDNDCDGDTDSGDSDCGGTCPGFAVENTMALCTDGVDNDCNGSQDNVMPSGDPNCEPMSCTPGAEPGPDPLEELYDENDPSVCRDASNWPEEMVVGASITYCELLQSDVPWFCCPPGCSVVGCGCFSASSGCSLPVYAGYEGSASLGGPSFVIIDDLTMFRHVDADNHSTVVIAPDGSSLDYERTSDGVTTNFNCQ
jgi:hypothetical protein